MYYNIEYNHNFRDLEGMRAYNVVETAMYICNKIRLLSKREQLSTGIVDNGSSSSWLGPPGLAFPTAHAHRPPTGCVSVHIVFGLLTTAVYRKGQWLPKTRMYYLHIFYIFVYYRIFNNRDIIMLINNIKLEYLNFQVLML